MFKSNELDFSKICRSCLMNSEDMKSLYDEYSTEMCVGEVLMSITTLSSMEFYDDDDRPKQICHDCFSELKRSYRFVLKCRESEDELRNYPQRKMNDSSTLGHLGDIKTSDNAKLVAPKSRSRIKQRFKQINIKNDLQLENCELNQDNLEYITAKEEMSEETSVMFNKKRYLCTVCGSVYRNHSYLVRHMRVHTGERPYSCPSCNSSFSEKPNLINHMRTHSGDKPYACPICDKQFSRNSHVMRHMLSHTGDKPYSCKLCKSSFVENSSLKTHMRIHTGEKPYCCTLCNRSFTTNPILTRHMRRHTGEKPHSCSLCDRSFIQKTSLILHMQNQHSNEHYDLIK